MDIKKHIFLNSFEVKEALEEYLSKKDITGLMVDLILYADDDDTFTGIEVVIE